MARTRGAKKRGGAGPAEEKRAKHAPPAREVVVKTFGLPAAARYGLQDRRHAAMREASRSSDENLYAAIRGAAVAARLAYLERDERDHAIALRQVQRVAARLLARIDPERELIVRESGGGVDPEWVLDGSPGRA